MPSWKKVVTSGSNAVLAEITASVGFKGDGSGLTNLPAQTGTITALNNQSANRLVSIGSTTTELDGEANLVFDGTNLGIGTTSPSSYHASPLVTYQATSNYLTIATNTNGISSILMADGTTGDQKYRGQLEYKHTGDEWKIHAANSVLATLNSSVGLSITGHITASGNIEASDIEASKLDVSAGDITIDEGQKLYLDGGSNTYISSTAGDTIKMITGGSDRVTIDSGGRVGISTAPSELLHIKSSANSATPVILLENTNAGTFAPQINMYNNSSSPADDDYVGQVDFEGKDSAGNRTQYARIISQIEDATANTEDGLLDLNVMVGGTLTNALRIKGGATGTELTSPGSISGSAFVGKQTAASMTGANNIDLSTSANHNVTITGNITLTPTNFSGRLGQSGIITLIQDSSGGHSITLNSLFKTPRGDSISFDTTADGISLMSYYVIDASNVAVNYLGPFS